MKVYLAGVETMHSYYPNLDYSDYYLLCTFYHLKDLKKIPSFINSKDFLLDSGAFTFMNKSNNKVNWGDYIIKYANFINKHDIKYFFELDIDSIVGLNEVKRLRSRLEALTKKQCIPVWHKSRGLDDWKAITKQYNYVAIGGIVTKEIKRKEHSIFNPLLKIAFQNKCKVHGLGYTNLEGIKKYKFHSVDSTSWISGQKFMQFYTFNGSGLIKEKLNKKNNKGVNPSGRLKYNWDEWIKFQKYADSNL